MTRLPACNDIVAYQLEAQAAASTNVARNNLVGGALLALCAVAGSKPAAARTPSCVDEYDRLLALYRSAPLSIEYSQMLAAYEAACIPGAAAALAYPQPGASLVIGQLCYAVAR
jgi:hypothetical protein